LIKVVLSLLGNLLADVRELAILNAQGIDRKNCGPTLHSVAQRVEFSDAESSVKAGARGEAAFASLG
jgi:hypothetical protein